MEKISAENLRPGKRYSLHTDSSVEAWFIVLSVNLGNIKVVYSDGLRACFNVQDMYNTTWVEQPISSLEKELF